ncbi:MAG: hypothetical protein JO303_17325 [Caulobacteraceae bacterium]|nr:hypothetical protein [Caulobacteraceae bacterium]
MTQAQNLDTLLIGPSRTVLNHLQSSIHDPAEAKKLGFRGSAVDGRYYLDVLAPLLVELYGQAWHERGAVSAYYLNVVVSGEAIQGAVERPPAAGRQTRMFARRADAPDILAFQGTASLGDHTHSELATFDFRLCDDAGLRMLKGVKPGQSMGEIEAAVTRAAQDAEIDAGVITDAMEWHRLKSPWGGPIATISSTASLVFNLLTDGYDRISPGIGRPAGMNGAIEIAYLNGPVFLDRPYRISGSVVGVGESPKTEYCLWDASIRDEHGGEVARMRHLQRFLKASSPLYPELSSERAAS